MGCLGAGNYPETRQLSFAVCEEVPASARTLDQLVFPAHSFPRHLWPRKVDRGHHDGEPNMAEGTIARNGDLSGDGDNSAAADRRASVDRSSEVPTIETRNLSRFVSGRPLVDGICVKIQTGEVLAVVGPSGAGKSSFLRLLNRLDEPTGGAVLIKGEDYREIAPRELRRRVGMVMQTAYLFPG